ncbi:universal stress protein [Saccharothrix deserti]|uniref:universal stress protein n=1 Tax=Saccharothrix deserti TaxID=2593674 RepID=UPI003B75CDDB
MFLGSTTAKLVRECDRPVAVVPGSVSVGAYPTDDLAQRQVVVGVDGSDTNQRAIGFAYDIAAHHDADLLAVHAWGRLLGSPFVLHYCGPKPRRRSRWDGPPTGIRRDRIKAHRHDPRAERLRGLVRSTGRSRGRAVVAEPRCSYGRSRGNPCNAR